jgi:hypothetical protein
MKLKDALISLASIAVITALGVWGYFSISRPVPDVCRVCERSLHAGVTYRLELARGHEDACCPRCGMHYQIEHPGAVRRALASDWPSGKLIPAEQAFYIEGGNISHCTMHSTPVERQPQGVAVRDYDRCLPSLVAFESRQSAEAYQQQHGGELLDYAQVMAKVKAL